MSDQKAQGVLRIIIGCISIVLAIVCFVSDTGVFERSSAYGGDAYTGIQNAGATTANNAKCIAEIVSKGFASILLVQGLLIIVKGMEAAAINIKIEDKNKDEGQHKVNPFAATQATVKTEEKTAISVTTPASESAEPAAPNPADRVILNQEEKHEN